MAKRRKKRKIKVKNILIFLIILVVVGFLFYFILSMPIRNIYIENNNIVSDNEIINLSGLDSYPSFLLTKGSDIKKRLLKNPYINSVSVYKKLGNIVVVSVLEYEIVAINRDNKLILSNGLEIDNIYDLSDIPVLVNNIDNKDVYKHFASKFGNVHKNILRQISQIEYSPVDVDKERFLLYMNDGNLVYITLTRIDKINKYNLIKDKTEGMVGVIYLDAGDYMEVKKNN